MFNLGYMHELGHGMPKDIHLAKRFYDMAAETSTDAKVPVAIALAKLGLSFAFSNWPYSLQSIKFTISPDLYAKLELYWDIYLLTLLVGLLGVVLLVRRPRAVRPQGGNAPVRETPQAAAPEARTEPEAATETASNSGTANESNSDENKNGTSDMDARQEPQETRPP